MKLAYLSPLYGRQGPFASVYVDSSRDIEDPERAIELRWRHLKQNLAVQGADMATAEAVAQVVGTDRDVPGPHGQAVFAAHGQLILAEELPEPPARDTARLAMLPDAMPLALQHAPDIPYVAVEVRRVPEPEREVPRQDLEVELQAGHWPTSRVGGGERTARRVPAAEWVRVAEELTELSDHGSAEVIVLCGDVWARGVLSHRLPQRLRERIIGMEGPGRPAPGRGLLEEELSDLFRGRLNSHDTARVEMFLARRARQDGVAEGLMGIVDALRRGQVEALLVNDSVDLSMGLWVGTAPKEIGLSEAELRTCGVPSGWEEPADAALIRAVVGTRAELIVVPREDLPLTDGLGALLRYRDSET